MAPAIPSPYDRRALDERARVLASLEALVASGKQHGRSTRPADVVHTEGGHKLPLSEVGAGAGDDSATPLPTAGSCDGLTPRADITPAPRPCFFCGQPYAPAGPVLVATAVAHLLECPGIASRRQVIGVLEATETELRALDGDR